MTLADFLIVWVGGALLVGFFGFFAVLLTALARMVRFVLRTAVPGARRTPRAEEPDVVAGQICAQPRCGHWNLPEARYCARCGSPLGDWHDADSYG